MDFFDYSNFTCVNEAYNNFSVRLLTLLHFFKNLRRRHIGKIGLTQISQGIEKRDKLIKDFSNLVPSASFRCNRNAKKRNF